MKLEAKARLIAAAMPYKELMEKIWANAGALFEVAGLRVGKARTFVWNNGLFELSLPGEQRSLSVSTATQKGKTVTVDFGFDVYTSNSYYRSTDPDKLATATAFLKKVAKALKAGRGMKCTIIEYPEGHAASARGKIAPHLLVSFPLIAFPDVKPVPVKPVGDKAYVVRITGQDGNSSNIDWNPLTGSKGPWTRDEAAMNVQDIAHHFEYDDDFKYPTLEVVRIS